jgi:hypothetical protein
MNWEALPTSRFACKIKVDALTRMPIFLLAREQQVLKSPMKLKKYSIFPTTIIWDGLRKRSHFFSGPVSLPNPQVGNLSNSQKENSANSLKENSANSPKENSASSTASVKSTDSQPPSPTYKVPKSQTENFLPPEITGT